MTEYEAERDDDEKDDHYHREDRALVVSLVVHENCRDLRTDIRLCPNTTPPETAPNLTLANPLITTRRLQKAPQIELVREGRCNDW